MTQTIIGVFASFENANRAVDRLVQEGVARSHLDVHAQDSTYASGAAHTGGHAHTADGHPGFMERVEHFFSNLFGDEDRPVETGHYKEAVRRGAALLTVSDVEESQVPLVQSALTSEGAIDIDTQVSRWQAGGYQGFDASATPYSADELAAERTSFAVVQEDLAVGKRAVDTGAVRVYSRATATPVSETVNLHEERATIERRPVDRPATAADLREGSIEVRETNEEAVVGKTSRVVEEVVVGKVGTDRSETINETLRGTDVEVERVEGQRVTPSGVSTDSLARDKVSGVAPKGPGRV